MRLQILKGLQSNNDSWNRVLILIGEFVLKEKSWRSVLNQRIHCKTPVSVSKKADKY